MLTYSKYLITLFFICTLSYTAQEKVQTVYAPSLGQEDLERLVLLNKTYNPESLAFINKVAPSLTGKKILDVGCGSGHMACELAKLGGKTSSITALDLYPAQLELAKQQAQEQDIHTIEFLQHDIYKLAELKKTFDIIYCRFVLIHLKEPEKALAALYACLNPQGILILEETMGLESISVIPYDPQLAQIINDIGKAQFAISQSNPNYGSLLPEALKTAHFKEIRQCQHHPCIESHDAKRMLTLIIKTLTNFLLTHQAFSPQKMQDILEYFKTLEQQSLHYLYYFKVMQIAAQKE